ncbi:uncharacterized protein MELLADRAFT_112979 [Melampsora larici-populina 98AG31]|uniref:Trehalose-phosphatase n=1 Tax=Melampsora larici-populina (strain 98AG31 / pathotype 3-4-7) TaxID=747676 RepID=F4S8B0_MELLP|nr:uncharacterized protein MELLADRAFT_112979 [Melampsora larici-populina 98AG31]EGF99063.1 hypothetical protein MELLADRAFT_112979 [Melampsora larici-populina 98AG31]
MFSQYINQHQWLSKNSQRCMVHCSALLARRAGKRKAKTSCTTTQSIAKPLELEIPTLSAHRAPYEVPALRWEDKEVEKAINSKRLLLLLDYHGTLMGYENQDHPKLMKILKKISQTSDLVITSGGPAKELLERFDGIPHLTIAAEMGAAVFFEGKEIKSAPVGTREEVKRIEQICNRVIKDLDKDEYVKNDQLKPYPDREYSYRFAIGEKVDPNFISLLFETIKQELKDEGLTAWNAVLPRSKRFLNIWLANQSKIELADALLQKAINEGQEYDYVIGMGDAELDEPLLEYLNQHTFLSIMVENEFHKRVWTAAQFRLPLVEEAQDLLEHIANQRIKRIELQKSE